MREEEQPWVRPALFVGEVGDLQVRRHVLLSFPKGSELGEGLLRGARCDGQHKGLDASKPVRHNMQCIH